MKRSQLVCCLLALICFVGASYAQVSQGGSPASLNVQLLTQVATRSLPPVDHTALLAEDATESKDVPFRFGYPHEVSYNLTNSGSWEDTKDGRVWRLRIASSGAYSINVLYDQFDLPAGGQFFVYNDNHEYIIGAFTDANENPDGRFATQPVPGDAITLEYIEPYEAQGQGAISVMRVVHAYRNMFGRPDALDNFGDSGTCNNNVNCPEGAAWQDQKRGVVMLLTSGGFRYCSGSLINNVNSDATPFILTANHCDPATNDIFMFNYESPACANVNGPTDQTVQGCQLLANQSPSDFFLVRLNNSVPLAYNPYFNGWNASDVAATNSVGIHHPSGDIKKISFDNQAPQASSYGGSSTPGDNTHWHILNWEDGTTEGGSSGSPLFDQNHRITGQLHGGTASCSNNIDDYYGKFSLSMTSGLRTHLDPGNTGVMALDGYDPQSGGVITGVVTDLQTGNPVANATVSVVGGTQSTTTNASGVYQMNLADSTTYDLAFSAFAYVSDTVTGLYVAFQDTLTANMSLVPLPIITVLNETFESGAVGWAHTNAGGTWVDDWHVSTERSHSATHSYKCGSTTTGTYQALNDARLTSPVLNNLPTDAVLSFWLQMEGEVSATYADSAYDGGILEVSVNGGVFTQLTPNGGYTETFRILRGGGNPVTGPMPGLPCWSGTMTTWTQVTVDLAAYAGQNVQLRFRFGSDAGTNREGWYVDDVLIQAVGEPVTVTVPQNLTILVEGADVILRWDDDANPFYLIYSSNDVDMPLQTIVDGTDQNTYTIVGGATSETPVYYSVVGWMGN
ncbi:MAG: carboxypeptidase-like regulatory domain-containing protein [bacterium]|nr:carboxypeptidase-like regulatory domain-containing protein [bacterium]